MSGKKVLKLTAILLAAVLAFIILFLSLTDFGFLKTKVETAVSEAMGNEFRVNGDFSVKILPTPTLLIEDAYLNSPSWSKYPHKLEVGKAFIKIDLLSLLYQPIEIDNIELHDLVAVFELKADEQHNWDLPTQPTQPVPEEKPSTQTFPSVIVHAISIRNTTFVYQKPAADEARYTLQALTLTRHEDGSTVIDAHGTALKHPIELESKILDGHVDSSVKLGNLRLTTYHHYTDQSLAFKVSLESLAELGNLLEIDTLPADSLVLSGQTLFDKEKISLQKGQVTLGDIETLIDGTYSLNSNSASFSTQVNVTDLTQVATSLPTIPLKLKAQIDLTPQNMRVHSFQTDIGDSRISGDVELVFGNDKSISANLSSKSIDLTPFLGDGASAESPPEKAQQKSKWVFQDEPIPFEQLNTMDFNFSLDVEKFIARQDQVTNLLLKAELLDQKLTLNSRFDGQFGGHYESTLKVDATGEQPNVALDADIQDLKLGLLSGGAIPATDIPKTSLAMSLKTNGQSPRKLAENLNGKLFLQQGKGKVNNDIINRFSGDIVAQLFNALNPLAQKEAYSNWECSVFLMNFQAGLGSIDGFLLQSDQLMVVGGGEVDLNTEHLNFEFNTKPRKGVGVSADMFVTPFVKLTGTLASPSVGLNKKGVLLSGGAAILTGGMSFLYTGIVDRATAENSKCEKVLNAVENMP